MAEPSERLMVIPARGGSKRLPRKNVLPLAGKPLICWTIEAALQTRLNARIMVTSDDEEILCIARRYASEGVIAHRRPEELATDHATTADVLQDAVNADQKAGKFANTLILLQPTSPLRSAEDIRTALEKYESCQSGETVVSVSEVDHPTSWVGIINADGYLSGLELTGMRSQDYRKEFRLNGAVYVASTNTLRERGHLFTDRVIASVMPRSRSIDIDEAIDFTISECLIVNKNTLIEQ